MSANEPRTTAYDVAALLAAELIKRGVNCQVFTRCPSYSDVLLWGSLSARCTPEVIVWMANYEGSRPAYAREPANDPAGAADHILTRYLELVEARVRAGYPPPDPPRALGTQSVPDGNKAALIEVVAENRLGGH